MIEIKDREQLKSAIARAMVERKNLLVQLTDTARKYRVINRRNGQVYEITFFVNQKGQRFGECTCQAGKLGRLCKHLAAAAALNMYLAKEGLFNRQVFRTT